MSLLPQLKTRLLYDHTVTEEQMAVAEQMATQNSIPLDQALVNLQFAGYAKIGKSLSELTEIPYRSLLDSTLPPEIAGMIAPKWALRWSLFPVSYDPVPHLLTMAVSTPDLIPRVHHLYNFFMEPYTLAFTIASEAEIRKALEMNFGISVSPAPAPASSPAPKEPVKKPSVLSRSSASTASSETKTEESSTPEKAADSNGRQRLPLFSKGAKPAAIPKSQTAADEMGRYLTNAAAMLTEAYVGEDAATISVIRHRVRYSHLLATRLNLPPAQVSRVVVAAWLSALMDKPHIVRQFLCPYNLEEILFSKETDKTKLPPEGRILDLISRYEDLKRQNSAACREVNLMRRNLHLLWSSSQADQPMLETFLQILMDEQFLSKLDRAAGRIVIVDQTGFSTANIVTLLTNDGYDVSSVSTADAAWDSIQKHAADMIICEVSQPQNSGLSLCRRIKGNANTSRIPFLFLVARNEEKRAAECLRAGADDFLVKPVDTEVLFLKMQKLMKVHAADASQVGVNGKLEDMSFTDMIQILSAGAKNMEIHLTRQGHEGRVFLKEGNVIHAATGSLQGDEAFYQLMKWRDGLFTTKPCATFPAATIQASTTSLMMEGARLSDEDGETRE